MEMDIDKTQAQEALDAVAETMDKASKSMSSAYGSPMLILWGVLWVVAYAGSHFYPEHSASFMKGMAVVGNIGMFLIHRLYRKNVPVKSKSANNPLRKVWIMWFIVFAYLVINMFILQPSNGLQFNVTIVMAVMLAYVLTGLWYNERLILVLGIAVTVATLIGYAAFKPYYCLWMAATGGLAFLLTGLYIHRKWR